MILVFLFIFLILYSYVIYPIGLFIISINKLNNTIQNTDYNIDIANKINIIIPAHNEEKVIGSKLQSILEQNFPKDKINIWIGLDACTDNTKSIVNQFDKQLNINIIEFSERQGKPSILNQILPIIEPEDAIVLISDADILLSKNTLNNILYQFENNEVILVDLKLLNNDKVAIEENAYLNLENTTKAAESKLFNLFQGVSGACYAIRKQLFTPIPSNFLVDDFFVSTHCMLQKKQAVFLENTTVFENRPSILQHEFNRRVRIASGNFQNLFYFGTKLLNPFTAIGFTFISHKLIRWLAPFFLVYCLAYLFLNYTFIILGLTLFSLLIALILTIFGFKRIVKTPLYFLAMQVAVIVGFFSFLKGINTNIWQPTIKH